MEKLLREGRVFNQSVLFTKNENKSFSVINQVTNLQCRQFVCLRIDIHRDGYGNIHLWMATVETVVEKKKSGYNKEKSEN